MKKRKRRGPRLQHELAEVGVLGERAEQAETQARARLVADYIAGMTDRFALDEHKRLFDLYE